MPDPISLEPTADNPTPSVKVPSGDLYVWDPVIRELVNTSREPPFSPKQAVYNFQVAHARYRWQVFVDGMLHATNNAPDMAHTRFALRAVLIQMLARYGTKGIQYDCWDFVEQVYIDPSTGKRFGPESTGMMNAELQLKGGFGDQL